MLSDLKRHYIRLCFPHNSDKEIRNCILSFFLFDSNEYIYENYEKISTDIKAIKSKNSFPIISLFPSSENFSHLDSLCKEQAVFLFTFGQIENVLRIEHIFFKNFEKFEADIENDLALDPQWEKAHAMVLCDIFSKYVYN